MCRWRHVLCCFCFRNNLSHVNLIIPLLNFEIILYFTVFSAVNFPKIRNQWIDETMLVFQEYLSLWNLIMFSSCDDDLQTKDFAPNICMHVSPKSEPSEKECRNDGACTVQWNKSVRINYWMRIYEFPNTNIWNIWNSNCFA